MSSLGIDISVSQTLIKYQYKLMKKSKCRFHTFRGVGGVGGVEGDILHIQTSTLT